MYQQQGHNNSSNNTNGLPMDMRQSQPPRHQRSTSTPDTDMMATPSYEQGSRTGNNALLSTGRTQASSSRGGNIGGSTLDMFPSHTQQNNSPYHRHHPNRPALRSGGQFHDYLPPTSSTSHQHETELIPPDLSTSCLSNTDSSDMDSIDRVTPQAYERSSGSSSTITPFHQQHHNHPAAVNPIVSYGNSRCFEPKRPDSVITTSSIISSSDTDHSQAGDSSTESSGGSSVLSASHMGPPSVYAMSGLYGPSPVTCPVSSSGKSHVKTPSSSVMSSVPHLSGTRQPILGTTPFTPSNQTGLYPKTAISSSATSSNESTVNSNHQISNDHSQTFFQPKQLSKFTTSQHHIDPRIFQNPHHPNLAKSNSSSATTSTMPFAHDMDNTINLLPTASKGGSQDISRGAKLEGRIRTISLQQSGDSTNEASKNILSASSANRLGPQENAQQAAFINNPSCLIKRHRRQKSYPVTFQPIITQNNVIPNLQQTSNDPKGYISSEINYKSTNPNGGGGIENVLGAIEIEKSANSGTVVTLVRHGSNPINGHKRSHSYGPQRPSHLIHSGHLQSQLGHRRTGSSVIETLQTLTGSCGHGDPNYNSKEASLAQFLDMLKKEQQEK